MKSTRIKTNNTQYQAGSRSKIKERLRSFRNTVLSVLILLVSFVASGTACAYFFNQKNPTTVEDEPAVYSSPIHSSMASENVDMTANIGVVLQFLTSIASPGDRASMSVRSSRGVECEIKVEYDEVPDTESTLIRKAVDEYNSVRWDWTIDENAPDGTWPVNAYCYRGDKSAQYLGKIIIKR